MLEYVFTLNENRVLAWKVIGEDGEFFYCLRDASPTMHNGSVFKLSKTPGADGPFLHVREALVQLKKTTWKDEVYRNPEQREALETTGFSAAEEAIVRRRLSSPAPAHFSSSPWSWLKMLFRGS
jgi:hypothetical protein